MSVNKQKVLLGVSWFFTVAIFGILLLFTFALLKPVDVLKNWTLSVDKSEYHIKDTIVITSHYDKVTQITGVSHRYIECDNPQGSTARYPASEGLANRTAQKGSSNIYITVPPTISTTPVRCHIYISIDYQFYGFRPFTENNKSKDFTILPDGQLTPNPPSSEITPQTYNQDTDNAAVEEAPRGPNVQDAPSLTQEPQPIIEPDPSPGLIRTLLNNVSGIINRL